jgi:hypothetical protein
MSSGKARTAMAKGLARMLLTLGLHCKEMKAAALRPVLSP